MQEWSYPARFEDHGEDGFVVTFPDFPEAITGSATLAESREDAADALGVVIREYLAQGRSIPAPRPRKGDEEAIPLDLLTAARAALARSMEAQNLTKVAVAARMGKSEVQVRRILSGHGSVRIEGVMAALRAVGAKATSLVE